MAASEAVALLEALRAQAAEVAAHGREMLRRVRGGQLDTKEVLEKLRPLEQRLKYHLEKLLRAAASEGVVSAGPAPLPATPPPFHVPSTPWGFFLIDGCQSSAGAEDPLSFRPAPSNMAVQEEEDDDEGEGGGAKAPGLGGGRRYVPPRLVPTAPALPEAESRRTSAPDAAPSARP
ncbi:neuroguidin isoform X2 [Zonotrichia albicollis]|uniref:neuroguidin isoform X2 n=1 Tax=Zonotrichia albicollis TaxID=44394 RepID=UPI003D80E05B